MYYHVLNTEECMQIPGWWNECKPMSGCVHMAIRSVYIAIAVAVMLSCIAVLPQQNNRCYALLCCHNKTTKTQNKTILLQCIASIALDLTPPSPTPPLLPRLQWSADIRRTHDRGCCCNACCFCCTILLIEFVLDSLFCVRRGGVGEGRRALAADLDAAGDEREVERRVGRVGRLRRWGGSAVV